MITYRAVVAIISLSLYIPALPTFLYIAYAHGPGNNAAYFWLTIFTCIRITGFGIQLYAETNDQDSNTTYYTGVAVLLNIGLSPLLLACVGMLSKVKGAIGKRMNWILFLASIPILLALALLVAGSIDPSSQEGPTFSANGEIKAAVALYMICFGQICYATVVILFRNYLASKDDQKLVIAVMVSLPFMMVRVLYIVLFAFANHGNSEFFNVISGNETTQLCMQVAQEYVITAIYLTLGFTLSRKHRKRDAAAAVAEAHSSTPYVEKRGRVKRTLRYVPVLYWCITLKEVTKPRPPETGSA